jgi:midasin (ATPase involved in ribosome maturation)
MVSVETLALEGYLLLGERTRNENDKKIIKETIERVANVTINEK